MPSGRLTNTLLLAVAGLGLLGGGTAWFAGSPNQAKWIWAGATVPVLVVVLAGMVRALVRGDVGVDLIAVLSRSFRCHLPMSGRAISPRKESIRLYGATSAASCSVSRRSCACISTRRTRSTTSSANQADDCRSG